MANLLGQNIGTNYKGILNLNTLNGNLSATLQAVTDGDGNASPLQLSTSQGQLGSVVFASGVLSRNTGDATGLRLFGGTLITTNDSGYIQLQRDTTNFGAPIFGLANGNFDSNFFRWERNGTEIARLTAPGNLYLGSGGVTPSARLHVRGDGTNPVFRVESTAGANFVTINNSGQLVFGSSGANEPLIVNYNGTSTESGTGNALRIRQRANLNGTLMQYYAEGLFNNTTSGTNISHHFLSSGYAGAAGNGNYRATQIDYTINNSGAQTGTATGIFLNATETALNGMTHNLIDLQVGGMSKIKGTNSGELTTQSQYVVNNLRVGGTLYFGNFKSNITFNGDNNLLLKNAAETSFGLLQFGGTTTSFPAIKRNAATLEVRLADDTGFAAITASSFTIGGTSTSLASNTLNLAGYNVMFYSSRIYIDNDNRGVAINNNLAIGNGNVATNSSSVLECISTTKGFLPPRMTTAERDAIATPATGLVIYNTTTNVLNFYNGTTWGAV